MNVSKEAIERHRQFWAEIAKKHSWYAEPFYVQVWVDANGNVLDSVSYRDIAEDIIVEE